MGAHVVGHRLRIEGERAQDEKDMEADAVEMLEACV